MRITNFSRLLTATLLSLCSLGLQAQTTDAVLQDFKASSLLPDGTTFDTLFYDPAEPQPGPQQYLADSLEIFADTATFTLNYTPANDSAYVNMWIDYDDDGQFEPTEFVYHGLAQNGTLTDGFLVRPFDSPRRALVVINSDPGAIEEPGKFLQNGQVSSLQFIMAVAGTAPKLALGSSGNRGEDPDCVPIGNTIHQFTMTKYYNNDCLEIGGWQLTLGGTTVSLLSSGELTSSAGAVGAGTVLPQFTPPVIALFLDVSSLSLMKDTTYELTCFYHPCGASDQSYSTVISFKTCKDVSSKDRHLPTPSLNVHPNPITSNAMLEIDLPRTATLEINLYDLLGRRIKELHKGKMAAGRHQVAFVSQDLPNGPYIISLKTPGAVVGKRIMVHAR